MSDRHTCHRHVKDQIYDMYVDQIYVHVCRSNLCQYWVNLCHRILIDIHVIDLDLIDIHVIDLIYDMSIFF